MNLNAAIKQAKKIINEREKALNSNANKIIVCTEYNKPLAGELVILLYTDQE